MWLVARIGGKCESDPQPFIDYLLAFVHRYHCNGGVSVSTAIEAPLAFVTRAREAGEARARRKAELERLHHDVDLTVHPRGRVYFGALLGLVFTALPLLNAHDVIGYRGHFQQVAFAVLCALVMAGFTWWTRRTIGSTAINRRTLVSVILVFVVQAALGLGLWALDVPLAIVQILFMLLWATVSGMLAIHIDPRLAPSAMCYFAAFLIAARWPIVRPYVTAGSNLLLTINVIWIWRDRAG